uniref:Endo/exonuclease/phosphatase domain-containing protein n=1 Tax=Angiostrongylus cantonensis TaxID=6313 RepID=A0A0K0D713_ANGCA
MDMETIYRENHTFFKVIIGDFNAKVGPRRSCEESHIGTHGLEWHGHGERISEFIMATKTIYGIAIPEASPSTMDVGIS